MSCSIYSKPLILDAKKIDRSSVQLGWLSGLIPAFDPSFSGVWRPIWVDSGQSAVEYVEPLMRARTGPAPSFSPCDCDDNSIDPLGIDEQINDYNNCSYCGSYSVSAKLFDSDRNFSPRSYSFGCCDGACDTRLKIDDYIPKIPVLNQAYLTGVYDFKYHKQFPACNNLGLGKERFVSISSADRSKILGPDLCIDWKLKETISEVAYDPLYSHHDSEYLHNKSYQRSKLTSATCGNFILLSLPQSSETTNWYKEHYPILSGLIGTNISGDKPLSIVPSPDQFKNIPYGIDQQKYQNIFIKNQKLGSYWKWNYGSGILCWYRYYDKDKKKDERPLSGIDLYIPPGDIFFANNDGPEPSGSLSDPTGVGRNSLIQNCPSGLKLQKDSDIECIIPSGSEFCYISANLYDKFFRTYSVLYKELDSYIDAFKISAILATAPQYDKITVDLLKQNIVQNYSKNIYQQIDLFNKQMQTTSNFNSVSRLNYISNTTELVNTLAHKYGAYLWIPPNDSKSITFDKSITSSFSIDLDFDMVVKKSDSIWTSTSCSPINGCYERSLRKNFSYSQEIGFPQTILRTSTGDDIRYSSVCNSGSIISDNYGLFSSIYINDSKIKSIFTSSGCIFFEDIYRRIPDRNTSTFCSDCDANSSFYLIPDAESAECGKYGGEESFCYAVLARRFNNSPPQYDGDPSPNGTRVERRVSDGTVRWKRGYKSLFFNPHIDLVAFHQQGGIFLNSTPFGLNNFTAFEKNTSLSDIDINQITIKFTTNDVGIKLYKLTAEYLQTNDPSKSKCKRFPATNSCKCLPLSTSTTHPISCNDPNPTSFSSSNVFTPSLSTRFSPRLKQYGGYSQAYLDKIFGESTLQAGASLPVLNDKIDPINPYGCDASANITLYNYTNTFWDIDLQNFSTRHADIYASVTENLDLLHPRWKYLINTYFSTIIPNQLFRRFTTKVKINETTLYANQEKLIFENNSFRPASAAIHLQNPFLESLILSREGNKESVLYPPSGKLLNSYIFNTSNTAAGDTQRGDESVSINLTLSQKYRKQILNFVIPPPQSMGNLSKGFFHPNKGLTSSIKNKTPLKDGKLFYDKPIITNEDNEPVDYDNGLCLYGSLNDRVINTINSINNFSDHKKLKLYLQINSKWYEYDYHNRGGYVVNNEKYIGDPSIFEYLGDVNKSQNLAPLLPSIPKNHIPYTYLYNHYKYERNIVPEFPLLSNNFSYTTSNPRELVLPGTRHYFMVPEIDPSIDTNLGSMDDIADFDPEQPLTFAQMIKFADGTRWICVNPEAPTTRSSYIWADFNYLYHAFSDMHIDFSKISKQGYIYNTTKKCNFNFRTYNPIDKKWDDANTIIGKKLIVKFVKKDGRPITNLTKEDVYIVPYTIFETLLPIRNRGYNFIDLLGSANRASDKNFHSFTITSITAPLAENDQQLLNKFIPSKWGDIIHYDGSILDPYTEALINPYDFYPTPTYNNDFYKIIVNNHEQLQHYYKIVFPSSGSQTSDFLYNHNDLVYYNILQKYNIGDNQGYSLQTYKYHNYLPFLDINILSESETLPTQNEDFKTALSDSIRDKSPITGTIMLNNMLQNLSTYETDYISPNNDKYFWINFNADNIRAKSTFVPRDTIYSPTLRIDDPPYWLYSTSTSTTSIPIDTTQYQCRETFEPSNIDPYTAQTSKFDGAVSYRLTTIGRTNPYFRYPIYCDTDDDTCDNSGCFRDQHPGLMQVGWKELKASYRVGQDNYIAIPDTVPYLLSYDAGVYNTIGNDSYIYIKRFELEPGNEIEFDSYACNSDTVFPTNYKSSVINPMYQKTLSNTSDVSHDQNVIDTDKVANEMLFRILYGESQIVNKQMLYVDNKILSKNDLIKYSNDKVEAKDIYDQILYNFDKTSPLNNLNLNGSLTINGVKTVGSHTNISIGNTRIDLTVVRESGKIYTRGKINNINIDVPIYTEYTDKKTHLIQSWSRDDEAPSPPESADNDTTITFLGPCNIRSRRFFGLIAFSTYYPGDADGSGPGWSIAPRPADIDLSIFNMVTSTQSKPSYAGAQEYYSTGGEFNVCCCGGVPCASTCCLPTRTDLSPRWWGLQYVCGQQTYGSIALVPPVIEEIPYRCARNNSPYLFGADNCSAFDIGYCRKNSCPSCDETLESIDEVEFTYNFEYCRTEFTLFGHAYRQKHRRLPDLRIAPREAECYNNENGELECETYPISRSVREIEDWIRNNALIGAEQYTFANPDGSIGVGCRGVYGNPGECQEDSKTCGLCGCSWFTDNASTCTVPPDCEFCWSGSLFREPNDWPGQEFCENNEDICGIHSWGDRDIATYRNIYLQSTRTSLGNYNPLCADTLATITYTSKSIVLNIGGKEYCVSENFNNCPTISVNSDMQQLNVIDSIDSKCDSCSPVSAQLSLRDQSQTFMTKTEKRKCIIGFRYVNSVNPNGITGYKEIYRDQWGMQVGSQGFDHQCGTGAPVEYGCYQFGATLYDWEESFMGISVECNIGLPGDIPASVAAYDIPEWVWQLSELEKSRFAYLTKGSAHIPTEDILEGIVPGTVSELKVESFPVGGQKRDRMGNITDDVVTAYVAYYEYDYIRPVNIQDILRKDEDILCIYGSEYNSTLQQTLRDSISEIEGNYSYATADLLTMCTSVPFPPNYRDNLTAFKAAYFYYANQGHIDGAAYTVTFPYFYQNSDCSTSISCYYNHNVFICPDDICCYADLGVVNNTGAEQSCAITNVYGTWPPPPGSY